MARNKEGLVLLLDVGPSMHRALQEVENVCSTLVRKKLVYNRSDEVGIVLFGTKETCNDLAKELGGYKHVVVKHDVKVVDEETKDALQNLPRGTAPGDFLDAIVVGLDMLIKRFGNTKGKTRLCLITDAQHPLRDPPQGTKEDQVDTIADQMKKYDIKMDCIVFRESGIPHNSVMDENDQLLYHFRDRSVAKVVQVDTPTSLLGALKTRNVLPVTVFRGDLEVSTNLKIKVWVYKKTSEEKFPTLKKYSDKAPPSDKFASHEVKVDYEYKSILEPDTVVPPEQRIKGYLYGPQVVPVSSAEWEAVKFKPEKGVKLLGFADRSSVPRHYFMKDVNSFVPEPGNTKAIVAASAIARAMQEMDKVAILRCVWRQGQQSVAFGVLTPNISSVKNVPDSFYFNILPFAEDVRDFQFRSFSKLPPSSQPTEEQQEAADNLVKMLDLAPPGREEILRPDFTPNPMLERYYNYLDLKSNQPDANPPPLDTCLRRITEPDPDVIDYQAPLIRNLSKAFELKENPKRKKARTQERLAYTGLDDQAKNSEDPVAEKAKATDDQAKKSEDSYAEKARAIGYQAKKSEDPSVEKARSIGYQAKKSEDPYAEKARALEAIFPKTEKVGKIRDPNPVQDFEAMLAERSSSAWVLKAIEEMKNYIMDLIQNSPEGDYYQKALQCFVALRKACIIEQEPNEFNQFVTTLYETLKHVNDVVKFFQLLASKNVLLISKEEASDSDVTEEMARSFLVKTEASSQ